jgi:AraC-like DNA-binding protein
MLETLQICSVILSVLTLCIIIFKHKRKKVQKTLLSIYIFSLTCYSFLLFFARSGIIIKYPHLWALGTPINYIHLVTFILFINSVVNNTSKIRKKEYFLFLLPIINIIALSSFYLKDSEFKKNHINYILQNQDALFYTKEGLLSSYWNYVMQLSFGVLFSLIALVLLIKGIRQLTNKSSKIDLIWLSCVSSLMFLGNFIGVVSLIFDTSSLNLEVFASFLFAAYIVIIFSYLFFQPRVLYGSFFDELILNKNENKQKIEFSKTDLCAYKIKIDTFFNIESNYLDSDFRQIDLANFIQVSKKTLSQLTTKIYQKKFNQLVNENRINYVLNKFENSEWLQYSLEGIALKIGFKSRTTFIKAFKEKTGVTPSLYKKEHVSKA